jgi:hypothetical protein
MNKRKSMHLPCRAIKNFISYSCLLAIILIVLIFLGELGKDWRRGGRRDSIIFFSLINIQFNSSFPKLSWLGFCFFYNCEQKKRFMFVFQGTELILNRGLDTWALYFF